MKLGQHFHVIWGKTLNLWLLQYPRLQNGDNNSNNVLTCNALNKYMLSCYLGPTVYILISFNIPFPC